MGKQPVMISIGGAAVVVAIEYYCLSNRLDPEISRAQGKTQHCCRFLAVRIIIILRIIIIIRIVFVDGVCCPDKKILAMAFRCLPSCWPV